MGRSYYSGDLSEFLNSDGSDILRTIQDNDVFEPDRQQNKAWKSQISILQDQLGGLESGHIMFEYTIPRMGKRVDTVLIYLDFVFVIEFKVGGDRYNGADIDQCLDYALDLKNFHEESHCASIVPILVATKADAVRIDIKKCKDGVYDIARSNKDGIMEIIRYMRGKRPDCSVRASDWEDSEYRPTPTITEAAMALCSNISGLENITHSDTNTKNLGVTTDTINSIIEESKKNGTKSVCFVTGVPGSGKTLAALNLVCDKLGREDERAVLLSGNRTLVDVLRESLEKGGKCIGGYEGAAAASLIQHIPEFRDYIGDKTSSERIIVFDEAQRAWSAEKLSKNDKSKGRNDRNMSDPELLLGAMNKHNGWAVVVCLIGEGQEIYDGEVGLSGWLEALGKHPEWRIYHSDELTESRYLDSDMSGLLDCTGHEPRPGLHLSTSVRSFRGERLADLVRSVLECNITDAQNTWKELDKYHIVITRDISEARRWVRDRARGTERYGIVASSGAYRLAPHGIYVRSGIKPTKWFLAGKDDIRSAYRLEDVATEFYVQGLELDWVCLAWDANLRYDGGEWSHYKLHGSRWREIKSERERDYLVNAYRVLMTRARQGMVIFVPEGDDEDDTRRSEFYDGTYEYLKKIGFEEISKQTAPQCKQHAKA